MVATVPKLLKMCIRDSYNIAVGLQAIRRYCSFPRLLAALFNNPKSLYKWHLLPNLIIPQLQTSHEKHRNEKKRVKTRI